MAKSSRSLEPRVTKLEIDVEKHLMESGEIRTDIAWIKKGVYVCIAAGIPSLIKLLLP